VVLPFIFITRLWRTGTASTTTTWQPSNGNTDYLVPPPTSTPYPWGVGSGNIGLFRDPNWGGDSFWFNTSEYPEKEQAALAGTPLQDACTWVVFELPVGTVVTLLQSITVPVPGQLYNFAHVGSCVDLIGNGKVQTSI
jgi:hypothetical protein